MVLGILGSENKKGPRKVDSSSIERHLSLTHCLHQSGLCTGACAIDFIGNEDIGEHRTFTKGKIVVLLIKNEDSKQVTWKKVTCKLDTMQFSADGFCEGTSEGCFSDAWHIFDKYVSIGEKGDNCQIDNVGFAFKGELYSGSKFKQLGAVKFTIGREFAWSIRVRPGGVIDRIVGAG